MKMLYAFWSSLTESWQIALVTIALPGFLAGIQILFKGNRAFFKLLQEFQDKLPPIHKRAKERQDILPALNVLDTSKMKMNLTTAEIDTFNKKLENFNYSRIIFKRKEITAYSKNLQRLIRESPWEKFGIAIIQNLLEDESYASRKPYLFGRRIGKIIGF